MRKRKENIPEIKIKNLGRPFFCVPWSRYLSDLVLVCGANGAGRSSSSWFLFCTRSLVVNKHIVKRERKKNIPLPSTHSTALSTPCPYWRVDVMEGWSFGCRCDVDAWCRCWCVVLVIVAVRHFVHIASNIQIFSTIKRSIKLFKKKKPYLGARGASAIRPQVRRPWCWCWW